MSIQEKGRILQFTNNDKETLYQTNGITILKKIKAQQENSIPSAYNEHYDSHADWDNQRSGIEKQIHVLVTKR
jgi:hypothetical protein